VLPFVLYFVAALFTGYHLYALMSLVVYGVPVNPLELLAFLGSFALLVAAYVSLFRPRAAARIALIACLALWSFYAPALANYVRTRIHNRVAVSELTSNTTALWMAASLAKGSEPQ
jgi:hypothetical protein